MLITFTLAVTAVTANDGIYCGVGNEQPYIYTVPKHSCGCNKKSEGTLRYHNKKLQICNGEVYIDVSGGPAPTAAPTTLPPTTLPPTTLPPPIGDKRNPGSTCNDIASKRSGSASGYYYLKNGATVTKAYCYMGHICGSKGWTMIMKINGRSRTFSYNSMYWRNKNTFNPGGAASGLGRQETKLATYWTYPFRKLCLGMSTSGTRWLTVHYSARSLYDVIAPGGYRRFHVGRHAWKNWIPGSSLQHRCGKEGFNVIGHHIHSRARIGIIGNQENECTHPDSRIGLGTAGRACGENDGNSAGNEARCGPDNGNKSIFGFGYIFAQ